MQTQKVRLLNGSIYNFGGIKDAPYPLIVNALVNHPIEGVATVLTEVKSIDDVNLSESMSCLKYLLRETRFFNKEEGGSWQVVSNNPFDYWNRLKNSREAGEMPKADTYL